MIATGAETAASGGELIFSNSQNIVSRGVGRARPGSMQREIAPSGSIKPELLTIVSRYETTTVRVAIIGARQL